PDFRKDMLNRNNIRRGLLYSVLLIILIVGVVGYLLYTGVIIPIVTYFSATPAPPPSYAVTTVSTVCRLLNIGDHDPFCEATGPNQSGMSNQNARTLQDALYRNFPIGKTTYDDIMPLLKTLPSEGRMQSLDNRELNGRGFKPDGCKLALQPH